jgi:hypothetical protein
MFGLYWQIRGYRQIECYGNRWKMNNLISLKSKRFIEAELKEFVQILTKPFCCSFLTLSMNLKS